MQDSGTRQLRSQGYERNNNGPTCRIGRGSANRKHAGPACSWGETQGSPKACERTVNIAGAQRRRVPAGSGAAREHNDDVSSARHAHSNSIAGCQSRDEVNSAAQPSRAEIPELLGQRNGLRPFHEVGDKRGSSAKGVREQICEDVPAMCK